MSVFRKIIQEHLREGEMEAGEEIGIQIDQVLIQDITGTVVMLNFEAMGLPRVRCRVAAAYGDHNVLQVDSRNTEDHLYLASAGRKYGIWWAKPSSGIGHQIHQEHFALASPGQVIPNIIMIVIVLLMPPYLSQSLKHRMFVYTVFK